MEKPEHKNIFEALSALQGENIEVPKNQNFGKEGDKIHFKYANLDDMLMKTRPSFHKHGLVATWEGQGEKMVCAVYHTTYKKEKIGEEQIVKNFPDGSSETKVTPVFQETGVMRSLPISVLRNGEMKDVGADSTYARRYTLSEVIGIATDDDKDARMTEKRANASNNFVYKTIKSGLEKSASLEYIEKQIAFLANEAINPDPKIGLDAEQCKELGDIAQKRKIELTANQGK